MNHTPGPWIRERGSRFKFDSSAGIRGPDGIYVAAALDHNDTARDDEVEATAILIAAAPDLLEAARAALDHWGTLPSSAEMGTETPGRVGDLLSAAIAKATA